MNRRELIRRASAAGAVGVVTGLAGCTNPFSDGDTNGGSDNGDDDDGGDDTPPDDEDAVAQAVSDAEDEIEEYFELFDETNDVLSDGDKTDTNWASVRSDIDETIANLEELNSGDADFLLEVLQYVDYTATFFDGIDGMIDELDSLVSDYSQGSYSSVVNTGYDLLDEYEDVKINSHRARQVYNRISVDDMESVDIVSHATFSTISSATHRNANAYEESIEVVVELSDALLFLENGADYVSARDFGEAIEAYDDGATRFRRSNESLEQLQTWGRPVHRLDESRSGLQCGARIMHEVTEDYLLQAAERAVRDADRGGYDGENQRDTVDEGREYYNERCPNSPLDITWPSF